MNFLKRLFGNTNRFAGGPPPVRYHTNTIERDFQTTLRDAEKMLKDFQWVLDLKKTSSRPLTRHSQIIGKDVSHHYDNTSLYRKRGWKKNKNTFRGYYRTKYGAWKGCITRRGDIFDVFFWSPPAQLQNHPRWVCFHRVQGDKFKIDLAINPKDKQVDSVIFYVERLICESMNLK